MPLVTTQNLHATGRKPIPTAAGSYLLSLRCTAIVNGTGAIADVVPLAKLPAGCVVVDWELDSDDLDTGTNLLAVDLGVIVAGAVSAAAANGGKWLAASTGLTAAPSFLERRAQTATVVAALARMSPDVAERSIGLVLTAAGNAAAAANAVIGLKLTYRAAYQGN
jgi:hypothetical protein